MKKDMNRPPLLWPIPNVGLLPKHSFSKQFHPYEVLRAGTIFKTLYDPYEKKQWGEKYASNWS